MSLPLFPLAAFPNTVAVRLCEDVENSGGGFNPVPGDPVEFAASAQDKGARWETRGPIAVSVSYHKIYFITNPDLELDRPIRAGDQIEFNGLALTVLGPVDNRGGLGFLWKVHCEYIHS